MSWSTWILYTIVFFFILLQSNAEARQKKYNKKPVGLNPCTDFK